MAEFEEQLRRDPQSFSPLPRERAVLQGERLEKNAEIGRTLAHFGRLAGAAVEYSQNHGTLDFMATGTRRWRQRGSFLIREENGRPDRRRDLDAMFAHRDFCAEVIDGSFGVRTC